jgi:hypothetical protein
MFGRLLLMVLFFGAAQLLAATAKKDLRNQWMIFDGTDYQVIDSTSHPKLTTVYIRVNAADYPDSKLAITSGKVFFVFINGKLIGEHRGALTLPLDSLADLFYSPSLLIAIHQKKINARELNVSIVSPAKAAIVRPLSIEKPDSWFRDFVIAAGLIISLLFLAVAQLNPKLASDYFSVNKILSLRDADDSQATARLTSTTNIQFYICCSLLLGYYLLILFHHLPNHYALPPRFQSNSFGTAFWQWIKLSSIVLCFFLLKITLIFALTRLFGMRGMARVHFFNWVRLMLIVFGSCTIIVFLYFINHGQQTTFFVVFLSLVSVALIGWVLLAFLKLNGKSEHSLFHLFSYICATEIIPLLITVQVLYQ